MLTLDKIFWACVVLKDIVRSTSIVSPSGISDNCELYRFCHLTFLLQ